jgi:hypothetical protein
LQAGGTDPHSRQRWAHPLTGSGPDPSERPCSGAPERYDVDVDGVTVALEDATVADTPWVQAELDAAGGRAEAEGETHDLEQVGLAGEGGVVDRHAHADAGVEHLGRLRLSPAEQQLAHGADGQPRAGLGHQGPVRASA